MREAQVEILPGLKTTVWGYEGKFPGPTVRAKRGRKVIVQQTNQLPEGMSVHLHGGHVMGKDDGMPMDLIATGASKTYEYPNDQPAATLWYHDHAMSQTAPHVYKGLAGLYIIEDDEEERLPLPNSEYEVPLVIQDRLFSADGSLDYSLTFHPHDMSGMMGSPSGQGVTTPTPGMGGMHGGHGGPGMGPGMMGGQGTPTPSQSGPMGPMGPGMGPGMMGAGGDEIFTGDTLLVNGAAQPFFEVANRKYHLRILNGSNATDYELALSSGQPFVQIGTEGGLLPAPVTRSTLYLGAGERVDVVVDFAGQAVGAKVVLQNRLGQGSTAEVMRFDVARDGKEEFDVPQKLRDLEVLEPGKAARSRDFVLSQAQDGSWLINGLLYDEKRTDVKAKRGEVEIWRFLNQSMMAHPMHIHQTHWQILDRNGQRPPEGERGWKDTFVVQPMEVVRVIGRWSDYTGTYVQHCHILEHEDRGMMQNFEVT